MHWLPEEVRLAYAPLIGQDRKGGLTCKRHLAERLRGRVYDALQCSSLLDDIKELSWNFANERKKLSHMGAVPPRPSQIGNGRNWIDPGNWTYAVGFGCIYVMLEEDGKRDANVKWVCTSLAEEKQGDIAEAILGRAIIAGGGQEANDYSFTWNLPRAKKAAKAILMLMAAVQDIRMLSIYIRIIDIVICYGQGRP